MSSYLLTDEAYTIIPILPNITEKSQFNEPVNC